MGRSVPQSLRRSLPRSLPGLSPRTSEWAVPRVAGRFSDSETSWVLAGGNLRTHVGPPARNLTNRSHQVLRRMGFQNDPFGTGPNAMQNVMALGMHGENC